jgi:nucleoid-associated protein YgaU
MTKEVTREDVRKQPEARKEKTNPRPLVIAGAIALVAAVGVVLMAPGLIGGKKAPESLIAAAPPAAQPVQAPVAPVPAQHAPAPTVNIPMPAQAERGASLSPPLRPASVQPDASASDAPLPGERSAPVAGAKYRVMRGDMLTDIAFQVYHDASKFRLIQAANPSIRNKNLILVDQVIFIPQDSRPQSR